MTYLFDTCTHKCGYCELAEGGMVLDAEQLSIFREPAVVDRIASFFNRRSTDDDKWLLQLTGGEPLLMPNLGQFCERLFEHGNRVAFYTALDILGRDHPSYRFLLDHGAPEVDYVMASLHPESEQNEDGYFERVAELKAAGHNVFLRFVGHPARLEALDRLSARCRELDVCFYPTTLFGPDHPLHYTPEQRDALSRHFSSYTQRVQLEGGVNVEGVRCTSGSRNLAVRFPSGDLTPCTSTMEPILGNVFEDRLDLLDGPAPCPVAGMACACDVHYQQDIVLGAGDSEHFRAQKRGFVEPLPLLDQEEWIQQRPYAMGNASLTIGRVSEGGKLAYTREEVREAFIKWKAWIGTKK